MKCVSVCCICVLCVESMRCVYARFICVLGIYGFEVYIVCCVYVYVCVRGGVYVYICMC